MAFDLTPRSFFDFHRLSSLFDEEDWMPFASGSGLTVSEDEKNVYVEASVPGVPANKVDVTYEHGVLWVRGKSETKEEDKKKKYYRKATSSFSYHLTVPGDIDKEKDPDVTYKNGVLKASFKKLAKSQPKRLSVKEE